MNPVHLGFLPKQSSLVNAMLLGNECLIFFALRAHFSCEVSSFSFDMLTCQTVTKVKLQQSPHLPTVVCVEGIKGRTHLASRAVCSLGTCSGHAPFIFSVIYIYRLSRD